MANASGSYANWDEQLPSIMLGYNCSVQDCTKLCPYTIVHAVDPVIPPAIKDRLSSDLDLDNPEEVASSLEADARPEILRVVDTRPSGVVVLEGKCCGRLTAHVTHVAQCHLPITDEQVDPRLAKPPLTLACEACRMPDSEEWMLLCDSCTGWHTYCLKPPLEGVVMYAGKLSNVHHFTIEYPDKTSELVSLKELRPRLVVPGAQVPASAASATQQAPSVVIDAQLAATASECAALAEMLDLGSALSVFAPVGLSEQTAGWV
ncbi:hypothetical protein GPECTOR_470g390 [Gonium pectorale]|uniref:PHD-type domain-containing protein n=1 Tax=Gonium pectorale TaxID=33097 RepID=A0A150FUZ9_GONPE|nr:hypothetical protein GPECTOR_470g390 [Gonium pectorale]|eukprot:KXZ41434.1 hypothetical protein GPECTOR_470g390 [Gonium pectorale]